MKTFKPFNNLSKVSLDELVMLDIKRAFAEGVMHTSNLPFFKKGENGKGVLLIHGFTASPYEMSELGNYLHKYGYSVYGTRVAGHGTSPPNLNRFSFYDWYESLKYGYFSLKKTTDKIFIVGQSMGALLGLTLSLSNHCDGLILLSPVFSVKDKKFYFVPIVRHLIKFVSKTDFDYDLLEFNYPVRPVKGLDQLRKLMAYSNRYFCDIQSEMIIYQSVYDDIIDYKKTTKLFSKRDMGGKNIVLLDHNKNIKHVLTDKTNPEKEDLFLKMKSWLEEK